MHEALQELTQAVQQLEETVVLVKQKNNLNKEKIESLQNVIATTYDRINEAINSVKQSENEEEEICLSLS